MTKNTIKLKTTKHDSLYYLSFLLIAAILISTKSCVLSGHAQNAQFIVPPIKGSYSFTNSTIKVITNYVNKPITNLVTEKYVSIESIVYKTNTITTPVITTQIIPELSASFVPAIIQVVVQDAVIPPLPPPIPPTEDYSGIIVAPNGTSSGLGTLASPLDIKSALNKNHSKVISATKRRVWLRGGTYKDINIQPSLVGDAGNYWEVAPYNKEIVKFDADTRSNFIFHFAVTASKYVRFKGLELFDSRTSKTLGGSYRQLMKLEYADYIEFIHCSFHDSQSSGILINASVGNVLFYGCNIYANGLDTQLDHGIYFQHGHTGNLIMENTLLVNNAGTAFHGYTSGTDSYKAMANISVLDNGIISLLSEQDRPILFQAATSFTTSTSNCLAQGNYIYSLERAASATENHRNAIVARKGSKTRIKNNILWNAGLMVHEPSESEITGNEIIYDVGSNQIAIGVETKGTTTIWNNNKYFLDSATRFYSGSSLGSSAPTHSFDSWKTATGYDADSSLTIGKPTQNYIKVIRSRYDPNIIHVMIMNFQNLDSIDVDLSGILTTGSYILRHAGEPSVNILTGTYSGGNIRFALNALKYANALYKPITNFTGPKAVGFFIIKKV